MKLFFYTDPHLNLARKAHTTKDSVALREYDVQQTLREILADARLTGHTTVCLGDFFDTTTNPEEAIISASKVAQLTDVILAGNHDIHNREGRESSLTLLDHFVPGKIVRNGANETEGFVLPLENVSLFMAPHALTQAAYDAVIDDLAEQANQTEGYRILCLHCNWNLPEPFLTETSLNLSYERAYGLLSTFHFILLGHVHTPLDVAELDGRVKVIGSVFPTAFDNMTDKRALVFDTDTGTFEDVVTWKAESGYAAKTPAEALSSTMRFEYYDLEETDNPGEAQKAAVALFEDGAYFVRVRSKEQKAADPERPQGQEADLSQLKVLVEDMLQEKFPDLLPLWIEISKEVDDAR
jgi:DNA repair exonuclease SbcCD nuclease subunit